MEPHLSYDEILEERLNADREVQIVLARLRTTIVVVWKRFRRRRPARAGVLRRRWSGDRERARQILRLRISRS